MNQLTTVLIAILFTILWSSQYILLQMRRRRLSFLRGAASPLPSFPSQ